MLTVDLRTHDNRPVLSAGFACYVQFQMAVLMAAYHANVPLVDVACRYFDYVVVPLGYDLGGGRMEGH